MNTQRKLIAAMSLCVVITVPNVASATSVSGQGTWKITLQGRDLDGNLATSEAYYDTVLNITWLADANYAGTNGYGYIDGGMYWGSANSWAANLNPYGSGVSGWRLPKVSPVDGTTADDATFSYNGSEDLGYNVSAPGTLYAGSIASELAHMFHSTLGNESYCNPITSTASSCDPQVDYGLTNSGPFSNLHKALFWSGTTFAPDTSRAWFFNFTMGMQPRNYKSNYFYAWAVHDGDVGVAIPSAVPVPAAAWLFGSGLIGLIGLSRKQ